MKPAANKPLAHKLGRERLEKKKLPEQDEHRFDAAIARLTETQQQLAQTVITSVLDDSDLPEKLFQLSPKELQKIFAVFFGDLASAAVATWQRLYTGPYHLFARPMLYRSPKRPELTRARQSDWLKVLIELFMEYPSDVTTAEGLAVWGPYFDGEPMGSTRMFGMCFEGGEASAQVGRLLASVIDGKGNSSQNVLDTLRLAIEDRHPASMFGLHAIHALWNSRQEDVVDLILDKLASERNAKFQVSILRGATEADITYLPRVLRLVSQTKSLMNKSVGNELLTWFGFFGATYSAKVLEQCIELALSALGGLDSGMIPPADGIDEESLLTAWSLMTREVEDALPLLQQMLLDSPAKERQLVLTFAQNAAHPCMTQLFMEGLDSTNVNVVLQAMDAIRTLADKGSATERAKILSKAAEACRRVYAEKERHRQFFKSGDHSFFDSLGSLLCRLWTNESLSILGEAAKDPALHISGFIREGYVPPDEFSVEAILDHVEWNHDSRAQILHTKPLRPEQWCQLLQQKRGYFDNTAQIYANALAKHGAAVFQATLEHILAQKKSSLRAIGLQIIVEALAGPLAETAQGVAAAYVAAEPASKSISESEARLRMQLQRMLPSAPATSSHKDEPKQTGKSKSSPSAKSKSQLGSAADSKTSEATPTQCAPEFMPSAKVNALYPGLTITPVRPPVYRPMERMTPSCRKIIVALDKFIAEHNARLMQFRPHDSDFDDVEKLEQWYIGQWTDSYKQVWKRWWDENAAPLAGPTDLARLASYWMFTANFDDMAEAKRFDLSRLKALTNPTLWHVFPNLAHGAVKPIPLTPDVKMWRGLQHPLVVNQVFEYLWNSQGTWTGVDYMWDMAESILAAIPAELSALPEVRNDYSERIPVRFWTVLPECLRDRVRPADQPEREYSQLTLNLSSLDAYGKGQAQLGDVVESLLKLDPSRDYSTVFEYWQIANIRRCPERAREWNRFFDFLAGKMIDTELNRPAKLLSEWSAIAAHVGYLEGYEHFERMLLATAKAGFTRPTNSLSNQGSVWARLTAAIYPETNCDLKAVTERLKDLLKKKKVSADHLLQAAFLAPQWCEPIAATLNWPKLPRVMEWLLNHLSASHLDPDVALVQWLSESNREKRLKQDAIGYVDLLISNWYDQIKQTREDKIDRPEFSEPVYVSWFYDIVQDADEAQWSKLFAASEVLMTPKSAGELKTLVQALRGKASRNTLLAEVRAAKKPIDARPLALLPLATGSAMGLDVMERTKALRDYRKQCRRFMDSEFAEENVDLAMGILIFRAGVESEEDLEWIIQAAAADQFEKYRDFKSGDVEVKLAIDASGKPASYITKAGKALKAIPPAVKKNKRLEEQQQLLKSLQKFATHSRHVFQRALATQRQFTKAEIERMLTHPVLARQLESLLLTDGTNIGLIAQPGGQALLSIDERSHSLKKDALLRLVHPVDLIAHGGWIRWRDWLRDRQLTQVIPQVERGMFLPDYFAVAKSANAKAAKAEVQPMFGFTCDEFQFKAVLKSCGWDDARYERWLASAELLARIDFRCQWFGGNHAFGIEFNRYHRSQSVVVDFKDVGAIDFSECLRDIYAAASGSAIRAEDQEAAKVAAKLYKQIDGKRLTNVRLEGARFLIDGQLGSYTVDVAANDVRMAPSQFIPLNVFAAKPSDALKVAIETLASEKSERATLKRLKMLA